MRRLATLTAALWLCAAPALAQDDGVFVDPDSPTAKEYALPLDSARRQAAGQGGSSTPGGGPAATPAPRFGEGVGDENGGESGSGGSGSGSGGTGTGTGSGTGAGSGGNGSAGGAGRLPGVTPPARAGAPDGGGAGTALLIAGGAFALLLLGGGAGYALRRRPATS